MSQSIPTRLRAPLLVALFAVLALAPSAYSQEAQDAQETQQAPAAAPAAPAAQSASEVKIPTTYRRAMRRYLEAQGSFSSMGDNVAYGAANETLMAIANTGVEVTEAMQQIVLEEALEKYGKKFGDLDFLTDLWAPVYRQHFSEQELDQMTAFFESAVGKKSVELFPVINQEGMRAVQEVSFGITPGFQIAVDARFREAGIQVSPQ